VRKRKQWGLNLKFKDSKFKIRNKIKSNSKFKDLRFKIRNHCGAGRMEQFMV
jgi:hypothetical protein